jgi:hypothetical protein
MQAMHSGHELKILHSAHAARPIFGEPAKGQGKEASQNISIE